VDEGPGGLPKRRRGLTLAEAERRLGAARTAESRPAPAADDAQTRATRFNSFRQAVRSSAPDQSDLQDPAAPHPAGAPRDATAAPEPADTTAVPGPADSTAVPAPAEATAVTPSHQHAHPEGDPTS
jgi:hypothetical protein